MIYTLCMYKNCSNLTTNINSEYGTYCFQHSSNTNGPMEKTLKKDPFNSGISPITISMGRMNRPLEPSMILSSSKPEKKVKSQTKKIPVILDKQKKIYTSNQMMECCVCSDEYPINDKMKCGHLVCSECLDHLRSMKCPICNETIEGPLINKDILEEIESKYREDMEYRGMEDNTIAYLASLGYNPNNFY